jgi:hypothetical protein
MAQIINESPGLGALLGSGLGSGLGQGLNALAQSKLSSAMQRHQAMQSAKGLAALGIPFEQAHSIALLPQDLQSLVLKNYLQGAESSGLDQALAGILGTGSEQVQQREDQGIQQLLQQVAPQQQQQRGPELTGKDALLNAIQDYQTRQNPQQQNPTQINSIPTSQGPQKVNSLVEAITKPRLKPEHKLKVAELQQKNQQANRKLNHDYITKVYNAERATNQEDKVLKRVIAIREGGQARTAAMTQALKELGIDYQGLKNNDTLELEKLGSWFLQGASDLFGGRVSNQQMQVRLRQVPNDLQTDEGAKLLANQMLLNNESKHAEAKAIRDIIEENGGEPPWDLQIKAAKRVEKIEEDLAKRFINAEPAFTTKGTAVNKLTHDQTSKYKWARNKKTGDWYKSVNGKWVKADKNEVQ